MHFEDCTLNHQVVKGITAAGFTDPTPIQKAVVPAALLGTDIIGTAQTGTGKTAAFVIPMLHALQSKLPPHGTRPRTRALIVTPTRELAEQIHGVVRQLGKFTSLRSAVVYGGVGMLPQETAFRKGTEIIIACPGRLIDHMNRGTAKLDQVEILVLDEADRLLDMGFRPAIQQIVQKLPARRQTLLFSATFDGELELLAGQALRQPARFAVGTERPATTVAHALYPVPQHLKSSFLLQLLGDTQPASAMIFTRTKHRADRVTEKLRQAGFPAAALHANKSQGQRKQALDGFRAGTIKLLVATDIASRGLDIAEVSHVINFDMPGTATDYIHRIGRTGRASRTGEAFTLVLPEDQDTIRDVERSLGAAIERRKVESFDYTAAPAPRPAAPGRPQSTRQPHGFRARRPGEQGRGSRRPAFAR